RDLKAEVVGRDPPSDVAVLKVAPGNLAEVALGDSARIEVGDFVVAIGNPFGLQHTVTSGIVSGLSRSGINPGGYEDFIQTDASINPGNSGGALVNLKGELIGINTAILSGSGGNIGIGFAIPVNMARHVMNELLRFGTVKRGLLGVQLRPVTSDIAQSLGLGATQGALVTQVVEGSAAEKAGIKAGDVVTSVNGQTVKSNTELRNAIGLMRVGDKVDIGLLRDGSSHRVTATIAETPPVAETTAADATPIHRGLEGVSLADAPEAGGALVRHVEPGSAAQQAGLRDNDVIVAVNRSRVASVAQLRELAQGATLLMLNVRRGKSTLLIPLR
ncbi:MAG: PDZ domain-containing protein, partial [Steroidobacteraceae bacterium]